MLHSIPLRVWPPGGSSQAHDAAVGQTSCIAALRRRVTRAGGAELVIRIVVSRGWTGGGHFKRRLKAWPGIAILAWILPSPHTCILTSTAAAPCACSEATQHDGPTGWKPMRRGVHVDGESQAEHGRQAVPEMLAHVVMCRACHVWMSTRPLWYPAAFHLFGTTGVCMRLQG